MKTFTENKIHLNKGILLILLHLICTNISAQKYKKLFDSNDLEKLSEKTEKAYKKDSTNLLIIYYKSKLYAYHQPKNLNSSYKFVSQVCNDLYKITDNKTKEQYLEEDLTYYFANNFKQNVCALILDSIELNSSQLLNGYKDFINTYRCDINEKVKYKIDSLEFLTLKNDSNISKCENYLNENSLSAFKNEILAIIEYKTYQFLIANIHLNEAYQNFIGKFPNSTFIPEIKSRLFENKINNATLINDTNALNNYEVEVAQIGTIIYIKKIMALIENSKEKIYYQLCENNKDQQIIDAFLNTYKHSVYFERVTILKDSIDKAENQIKAKQTEEYEFPKLIEGFGFIDYYSSNLITSISTKRARNFKNGFASISRQTPFLFDGNEKWTFINKSGKVISDFIFDETHDFSENMAAVKVDGLWGFIDTSGKQIIKCKYQSVKDFKHGFAVAKNFTGSSFYIDNHGNQYGDGYYLAFPFCNNNRAIIVETMQGPCYYIDRNFSKIKKINLPDNFVEDGGIDYAKHIEDLMYDVTDKLTYVVESDEDKRFKDLRITNLVDSNNNNVIWKSNLNVNECYKTKDFLISFPSFDRESVKNLNSDDFFYIGVQGGCGEGIGYATTHAGVFNSNGKKILEITNQSTQLKIKNRFCYVTDQLSYDEYPEDINIGIYDLENKGIFNNLHYYKYREFNDGFCVVVKNRNYNRDEEGNLINKYGFIDINGKLLGNTINYDQVTSFKNGFAIVWQNGKAGIINTKSELIGNKVWDKADFYSKNYFVCKKENKEVIIDTNGIEVSPYFDRIGKLSEGFAMVNSNGQLSYLDAKGKLIFKLFFPFESISLFHNELAPAKFLGKWGFIDITGKFVIPAKYLEFIQFMVNDGFALVRGEDKITKRDGYAQREPNYFIIDKNGTKVRDIIIKK
jgi:hypothetical protein